MSVLRKIPHKTLNSLSMLSITTAVRCFTTQNPSAQPFPDHPTSAYYDQLVYDAGRSHDFNALRDLLNKRLCDGCFNTKKTFNFVTNTNDSLSILDDLIQTLSRLDKGITRKSAFDSLVSRLCKLNRIDDSLCVVEAMAGGSYGLNACTFHPILNVLTRKKTMKEAWRLVDLMRKKHNIQPDLTSYNYFVMSYCASGDFNAAVEVLRKMEEEEGMRADSRTYDALVLGACKAGKVDGALMVLRRMVADGLPMLRSTPIFVMEALLDMKSYEQAFKFVLVFSGKDKFLDAENFGVLAHRLIKLKKPDEAKLVLEEMKKRGLPMGNKLKAFYESNIASGTK